MEIKLSTDLSTALPQVIEFNHEELKAKITERLSHYTSLVITEDAIKAGKADRARLNQLYTAIDAERKAVKKKCLAPYEAFEVKAKEILELIKEPIAAIDSQLAAFEEQRKAERRAEIEAAYADIVPHEYQSIIPLGRIFNDKWLNATVKPREIEEALLTIVKGTKADLAVLDVIEPEFKIAVHEEYTRTLDITKALDKRDALRIAAQRLETQNKESISVEKKCTAQPENKATAAATEDVQPEKLYSLRLEFSLTRAQADALKEFLSANQIHYTKI